MIPSEWIVGALVVASIITTRIAPVPPAVISIPVTSRVHVDPLTFQPLVSLSFSASIARSTPPSANEKLAPIKSERVAKRYSEDASVMYPPTKRETTNIAIMAVISAEPSLP